MIVKITRTSDRGMDNDPPAEGASEAPYSGVAMDGNEYSGVDWVVEVDSLAELVDSVDAPVIISGACENPYEYDGDIVVGYAAEIYDGYRE